MERLNLSSWVIRGTNVAVNIYCLYFCDLPDDRQRHYPKHS